MTQQLLNDILSAILHRHQQDPSGEATLYSKRMIETLFAFQTKPSKTLQIACQAQHIDRWRYPRSQYPADRKGYLQWRSKLYQIHSQILSELLLTFDLEKTFVSKVSNLVAKKKLKTDSEVQIVEDVACLVFIEYYFDSFIEKINDEQKIISIVQKTWSKMTKQAHQFALNKINHSPIALELIQKALSP